MTNPLDTILPKMQSTHDKYVAFVTSLDANVANRPLGDGWSPRETTGHLADAERAHRRFMEAVVGGNPPAKMDNFDRDAWNASRVARRAQQSLAEILAVFEEERAATLAFLATVPDDAWGLEADHPALGHVTVETVARTIGIHERMHLRELQGE